MSPFSFNGVITALVTPFKRGALDMSSFKAVLKHQLDHGVQGFVIGGTTGEGPTLKLEELKELVKIAQVEVGGHVPIIVGTGSNSTARAHELTRLASEWSADAALVVVPYYNKPTQRGLVEHFTHIQTASTLPILLYNVPGRTITSLSLESIIELAQETHIIGIKEASGDNEFNQRIIAATPKKFVVLGGDDATCVDLALKGGDGVISVASHLVLKKMRELMDRAHQGDESAVGEWAQYRPLIDWLFKESNPIPVKMALFQMGLIASPELRLPLTRATDEVAAGLMTELKRWELLA
jgi:4-hydroxy-tetrahydrodipicolinate synthase